MLSPHQYIYISALFNTYICQHASCMWYVRTYLRHTS